MVFQLIRRRCSGGGLIAVHHQDAMLCRTALFLLILGAQFEENTGNLFIEELRVPNPLIFGSSTDLICKFNWDAEGIQQGRHLYSVKWYKENFEFYRYVPSETPKIVTFPRDGIFVDESRSGATHVHLRRVHWNTAGVYRCEVTADDFMTIFDAKETEVVAVPRRGPEISGQKPRYALGDEVNLNCTSNSSDPLADLTWYINGRAAPSRQIISYPWVREPTNLMTRVTGLRFQITRYHLQYMDKSSSSLTVKCTAMLLSVYLKSNEIAFEVSTSGLHSSHGQSKSTRTGTGGHAAVVPALESRHGGESNPSDVADPDLEVVVADSPASPGSSPGFFGGIRSCSCVSTVCPVTVLTGLSLTLFSAMT